ncbi:MAG: ATP-dependent helicase [Acholeplasmataceae bacterium]|nr:ATP-dependent helicase [Acholeplasmataceae bacterium]
MKFSEEQRKAIKDHRPFLFLQACAGSGKTRVIVERVKRHLMEGVLPEKILCLTFTKKASIEMSERLLNQIKNVYTFHQFCLLQLKNHMDYNYEIIDPEEMEISPTELLKISTYKNSLYRTNKPNSFDKYQDKLIKNNFKDFDDLLIDYLKNNIQNNFDYILIDEFQDTNLLQYEVIKKMKKLDTHIFAVGDPNQSIYRFRGSNHLIIFQFIKEFEANILTLSINYRSSANIVNTANQLVIHNPKKDYLEMIPHHQFDENVESYAFMNREDENLFIVNYCQSVIEKNKYKSIAVIYRNHERAYHLKQFIYNLDHYQLKVDETIQFLTIHQSKGLEFDLVILIGLEQGVLPSLRDNQMIELEEERRLCFVGMTRAKKKLILTHVQYDDSSTIYTPSVFLSESHVKTHHFIPIK